ncbi:Predicted metal-dependent phosphohydrolase, HD superfamily [Filimonas lacunae]|uniref:Predicted metal-dependent phosphohydrolase, HD superfamily n=1 Tax=Filimonas lacunae TaxID=477680 RepID=A0A173MR73_9BACT|nr:hypothetical protein [Filimonas lacunae]BAV09939.1 hypothetical protein FLA_5992 [Filimonas lacunae]SIS81412.1 Predicted metal-dependent phosphohydrolase, HD superfamily [Filimonas lacunae]
MLRQIFTPLALQYAKDDDTVTGLWIEIEQQHSQKGRYYHTLAHLENICRDLQQFQHAITNPDAVFFALFYHDIVYKVLNKDNEEKSALLAVKRLTNINVPASTIEACRKHILATKAHTAADSNDTNMFTDADLAILGYDKPAYETYMQQVRKEYKIYPDIVYIPGRKKVLKHFLQMERIFKTELFFQQYEQQARSNMEYELSIL